ncbi:hypothetical protein FN846DRAFT_903513 [Sphaerosporella brunnea]|uniref:Uncharacterized protein n=1 Tax=Sphaerosporella brunnea TaxID=1250544 RepID=A0A5J5F6P3_9PEZI|nr:hypothetical protein FN846DRAFT_903513 [Sphaerosporella brunnea]
MTLGKLHAQYRLPAPGTTDEKTHTLMAEFICDNGWYEAYDCAAVGGGADRGLQLRQDFQQIPGIHQQGVDAVIKRNHLRNFGTTSRFSTDSRAFINIEYWTLHARTVYEPIQFTLLRLLNVDKFDQVTQQDWLQLLKKHSVQANRGRPDRLEKDFKRHQDCANEQIKSLQGMPASVKEEFISVK